MALFDDIFSGNTGVANTLIDLFGEDGAVAVLRQKRATSTDDITGATTYSTTNTSLTITPLAQYKQRDIDDSAIKTGDVSTLIKATDIDSIVGLDLNSDAIIINSREYTIVTIKPVETGALTAMYIIQMRVR